MKVVLLTTDTPHHRYFAWQVAAQVPFAAQYLESDAPRPPFEVAHPFEAERDDYERSTLLAGGPARMEEIAETRTCGRLREEIPHLQRLRPDLAIVFGTRLLPAEVLAVPRLTLNLHGGNPEEYRGLDTHLWAIYHGDFDGLVTTLHVASPVLDDGAIVGSEKLETPDGLKLHQLRAVNTRACVRLALSALDSWKKSGTVPMRPQRTRGRLYSFMPAVLKEICRIKFEKHTRAS